MHDCNADRPIDPLCKQPVAPLLDDSQAGAQPRAVPLALRMAQYRKTVRRHPKAALGVLAYWLKKESAKHGDS
jgi:hypothetical protein